MEHKERIENLYRTETESLLNSHTNFKVLLSKDEAKAAGKLCKLLLKTDSRDKRPQLLYRSIEIKDQMNSHLPITKTVKNIKNEEKEERRSLPKLR